MSPFPAAFVGDGRKRNTCFDVSSEEATTDQRSKPIFGTHILCFKSRYKLPIIQIRILRPREVEASSPHPTQLVTDRLGVSFSLF